MLAAVARTLGMPPPGSCGEPEGDGVTGLSARSWRIGVLIVVGTVLPMGWVAAPVAAASSPASHGLAHAPIIYSQVPAPRSRTKPGRPGHGGPKTASVVYTPLDIQQGYAYGADVGGAGQTIVIVDAYGDPSLLTDLATFDTKFGITPPSTSGAGSLNISYPGGQPTSSNSNWALETALDVEWAHANAPAATIDLVVTPTSSFSDLLEGLVSASRLGPTEVSLSWGAPEADYSASVLGSYQTALATLFNQGAVVFSSAGDSGAYDGTHPKTLTVNYPASSPLVVGVGGTTLNLSCSSTSCSYSGETAWSGSGGGYSSQFLEPAYQTSADIPDSSGGRGVPDVAFDANPSTGVYVYEAGAWYGVGGTSVGAPNWAAIAADTAADSKPALTLTSLYASYSSSSYSSEFHDITSGSNGYYSAGAGWDPVTGIGTPQVAALIAGQ